MQVFFSDVTCVFPPQKSGIRNHHFGNPQHLGVLVPVVPFRFSGSWGCSSRNFGGLRPDSGGPDGATSRYQQILWGFESASAQKWWKSLTEKKSNKILRYVDGNRWKLWKMNQHYPKSWRWCCASTKRGPILGARRASWRGGTRNSECGCARTQMGSPEVWADGFMKSQSFLLRTDLNGLVGQFVLTRFSIGSFPLKCGEFKEIWLVPIKPY